MLVKGDIGMAQTQEAKFEVLGHMGLKLPMGLLGLIPFQI